MHVDPVEIDPAFLNPQSENRFSTTCNCIFKYGSSIPLGQIENCLYLFEQYPYLWQFAMIRTFIAFNACAIENSL